MDDPVGAWFITPRLCIGSLPGRDESRPYGIVIGSLPGRDESRPYGIVIGSLPGRDESRPYGIVIGSLPGRDESHPYGIVIFSRKASLSRPCGVKCENKFMRRVLYAVLFTSVLLLISCSAGVTAPIAATAQEQQTSTQTLRQLAQRRGIAIGAAM